MNMETKTKIKKRPTLKKRKKKPITYKSGGEGFIKWCEDFVRIKIYINGLATWCSLKDLPTEINPETGRCSMDMWNFQKDIARECLAMRGGRFLYRLIVLCWMRGEGKSLFVCLIQLWKFYNFPAQQIMLGANSKDQVKFVHFDIMRDIILNSPKLIRILGRKNVQEKEIRLKNNKNEVVSIIRSISSFSGIVSNITGYTFSEIFDMKNPKFFTQLDGSIRNIPNAMGVIDSTVSAKEHILYSLYDTFRKGLDKTLYFSHRESPKADHRDFTNPEMTQNQLNSYRAKFPTREFAMYFKNTWDAGAKKMFSQDAIQAMKYIGIHNALGEHTRIRQILRNSNAYQEEEKGIIDPEHPSQKALSSLIPIKKIYSLNTEHFQPRTITLDELQKLSDTYDTNFSLCAGADRADPMKRNISEGARTILSLVAKGLPGSKSNYMAYMQKDNQVLKYMYFLIGLTHVQFSDMNTIKQVIENWSDELGGVDSLCTERWGMWDIGTWCEDNDMIFVPITSSYTLQRNYFSELFSLVNTGRFKAPELVVKGTNKDDILVEEMSIFDHDDVKKFYGSPEKNKTGGVQDDSLYSIGCGIYGGLQLGINDFKERGIEETFGEFYPSTDPLVGSY